MTSKQRAAVDPRVLDLYNEYAHGRISRREFVRRVGALAIGGVSAAALIRGVMPDYAAAQTISFTDERIRAEYVEYPSPQGSGAIRHWPMADVPSRPGAADGPDEGNTRPSRVTASRTWATRRCSSAGAVPPNRSRASAKSPPLDAPGRAGCGQAATSPLQSL
jgi:hypothetical protein